MSIESQALAYVADGQVLGLGTGRAATAFIMALGERVRAGLRIRGVPTSQVTADLAGQLGIPLVSLADVECLDLAFDGADEVDPQLRLIKGYGGALVREKIVAASAKRFIVLVGPEKLVPTLGSRGKLPVEVVPFGIDLVRRRLQKIGLSAEIRQAAAGPFVTDNHNLILDVHCTGLADPAGLQTSLQAIPGVVGTGLFLSMADVVLIQHPGRVETWAANAGKEISSCS
jgi:ribose 5-phosphate isomerase A